MKRFNVWPLWPAPVLLATFLFARLSFAAPKPQAPPPGAVVQIKLRDLAGLIPRSDDKEILARLKAIEERLASIEMAIKLTAPTPLPSPEPLGKPK